MTAKQALKELHKLGASASIENGLITIDGDWHQSYAPYHEFVGKIKGALHASVSGQDKDFLRNVTTLGALDTSFSRQDKDFLRNVTTLGGLHTSFIGQDKDFLRNVTTVGTLDTSFSRQDKDFLRNVTTVGTLDTSFSRQDKDFLRNVTTVGTLDTSFSRQDKDFLRNVTTLGTLDTSNSEQHPDFLRNVTTLGTLDTYKSRQGKDFLRAADNSFKIPFLFADGILSRVCQTKKAKGVTVYITHRVGYTNTEYVATDGENYAHASTVRMAIIDLNFKKSARDTSWLKDKELTDTLSLDDAVLAYRCVTGACTGGVEAFLKGHKEQDSYTIAEIIEATKGQYGSDTFKNFFKN